MFADLLRRKLAGLAELTGELTVELTPDQVATLEAHYELLVRWNKILNLTRIDNMEEAIERHYAESLFLGAHLPAGLLTIADIGSGAGFPGFPVAVLRPDCKVSLIESHQRKAVFLREASRRVANIQVLAQRAEAVDSRFDVVISRAVSYEDLAAPLRNLAPVAYLLTGSEEPAPGYSGFAEARSISLPWGDRRFLRCFT